MGDEEVQIIQFLKGGADAWYTRREIARKAVKRKVFEENPHWLDPALAALVDTGRVEFKDGLYRIDRKTA